MTAISELLVENIGPWAEAVKPKASAGRGGGSGLELYGVKKLRGLILDLAVRGSLPTSDFRDEAARDLLGRIEVERAELVQSGQLKKTKRLAELSDDEIRFRLPVGWEWVRFGDICQHNAGKTLDKGRNTGELRDYLTTSNLYWGRFDLSDVRQMSIRDDELEKCTATAGDLLICEGGEAGRAAVWTESRDICFQNHVHRVRFFANLNPQYAQRFFEHLSYCGEIDNYRKGVGISNMSGKALASIPFALPPLPEQSRIVTKIDELMALCDKLEAQQADAIEAHKTLVTTVLDALTKATEKESFDVAWARIAEHFDTLFTTEWSVDQLERTTLQLAVMGRLVEQNSNDELAEARLDAAFTGKTLTGKRMKLRAAKDEVSSDFVIPVPESWEQVPIGQVAHVLGGKRVPRGYQLLESPTDYVYIRVTDMKDGTVRTDDLRFITREIHEQISKYVIHKEDIYVTIAGTIGEVGTVPPQLDGMNLTENASKLVFQGLDQSFLVLMLSSEIVQKQFKFAVNQMAQPKLALKEIKKTVIGVPPIEEQLRIVQRVEDLKIVLDALKSAMRESEKTQLLLADAITEQAVA